MSREKIYGLFSKTVDRTLHQADYNLLIFAKWKRSYLDRTQTA
jgi:hypothetical protein